jgi:(p)ppGpp synthase/HD superfamily hydrolase
MEKKISKIIDFIVDKHNGQVDKSGKPYVLHPITVALNCESESAKIVALLHDVIEDTDATKEDLIELGLSKEEIDAVLLLSKPKKEDYLHYVKRVAENPIAREVKIQDLKHNMDLSRLSVITEKDIQRVERYKKALKTLEEKQRCVEDDILGK